ncbi:creatininase family protein [Ottowia caeni]|uniref:creatininase family protein n=1 Tax=Ottowia caeni TaxID=2870339 RepID=UPI001E511A3C|nr:creatininase family protein [Ottowia caeni]
MPTPSRFWHDLATTDFAALTMARTIAVLPVAATEQHGPHLPLSVDADLAHGIVNAALPHLPPDSPALFLPVQAIGYSPEHASFPGTLTFKAETVIRLWAEIAESVAASGVRKLLIFNTHGGNVGLLDVVARDLRTRLGLLAYTASWFNLPLIGPDGEDVSARFSAGEHRFGVHAGQIETAMMRALKPERVRMEAAQDFHSTSRDRAKVFPILGNGKSAKLAWAAQDYNPAGAMGNAAAATAEDGRALLEASGRALAQLIGEIDRLPWPAS